MNINKICVILVSILGIMTLLSCDSKKETTPITKDKSTEKAKVIEVEGEQEAPSINEKTSFDYDLNKPDGTMSLPSKLIEISGLTYDSKANQLLAINDEKGRIFKLNPKDGSIIEDKKFAKKGDYEGVEIIGESIYVLESSGQLNLIQNNSDQEAVKIRTALREANDLEGLGYDKKTNALLLACKGNSNILAKQKLKKTKAVYSLSIADNVFSEEPVFKITDQNLEAFVNAEKNYTGLSASDKKKYLKRIKSFSPSAIAQHPVLDHFYILSSVGKTLVVIDRASNIVSTTFLDESIHRQPEGICFDQNANMYVSNEGKLGIAKIYRYTP